MEVHLPPELESFVDDQVASGAFDSPDSVLAAAVRALQADPLVDIKAQIMEGYRQAKAGEFYPGTVEDIISEAKARKAARLNRES